MFMVPAMFCCFLFWFPCSALLLCLSLFAETVWFLVWLACTSLRYVFSPFCTNSFSQATFFSDPAGQWFLSISISIFSSWDILLFHLGTISVALMDETVSGAGPLGTLSSLTPTSKNSVYWLNIVAVNTTLKFDLKSKHLKSADFLWKFVLLLQSVMNFPKWEKK